MHRADRLADLLAALAGWGTVIVHPLWPKRGRPARRVIVTARRGTAAPLVLAAGTVLHRDDGTFTDAADAALRGGPLVLVP